jgi:hypothetical protein
VTIRLFLNEVKYQISDRAFIDPSWVSYVLTRLFIPNKKSVKNETPRNFWILKWMKTFKIVGVLREINFCLMFHICLVFLFAETTETVIFIKSQLQMKLKKINF